MLSKYFKEKHAKKKLLSKTVKGQLKFENDKYVLHKHANGTTKLNLTFLNVCVSNSFLVSTLEADFIISMQTHVKSLQGFIKLL